jgi:hypothetical protein
MGLFLSSDMWERIIAKNTNDITFRFLRGRFVERLKRILLIVVNFSSSKFSLIYRI